MPRYYRRLSLRLFLLDMCLRLHVTTRVCLLLLCTYIVVQLFLGMLQCAEGLVRRALRRQLLSCPESVWFDDNDCDDDDEQRECALAPLQHTTCNPAALLQWPHLSSVRSYLVRCESPTSRTSRTVRWRVERLDEKAKETRIRIRTIMIRVARCLDGCGALRWPSLCPSPQVYVEVEVEVC